MEDQSRYKENTWQEVFSQTDLHLSLHPSLCWRKELVWILILSDGQNNSRVKHDIDTQVFVWRVQSEHCGAEPEVGPCRASFQRWYHDRKTGSCQSFIYGGCNGNKNNFDSKESCVAACTGERHTCRFLYKWDAHLCVRVRQSSSCSLSSCSLGASLLQEIWC